MQERQRLSQLGRESRIDVAEDLPRLHRDALELTEPAHQEQFPYQFEAYCVVRFGTELSLELSVTNTGERPFDFEEALHAYLVVGDVHQAAVTGLADTSFFDKVTGTERVQQGDLTFAGETDSVYRTGNPVTLHDPALGRRLVVTTTGASNLVVWNPWATKAAEVPDIGDDDWERFVCIEGANAFENAVALDPGQSHTLTYQLEVQPL